MVNDVSAIFVEITIFLPGLPFLDCGADSNIRCCFAGGNDEYNGYTLIGPTSLPILRTSCSILVTA